MLIELFFFFFFPVVMRFDVETRSVYGDFSFLDDLLRLIEVFLIDGRVIMRHLSGVIQ
jgi:hypothetical protein